MVPVAPILLPIVAVCIVVAYVITNVLVNGPQSAPLTAEQASVLTPIVAGVLGFILAMVVIIELGPKPFAQLWQSIRGHQPKKRPAIGWAIIVLFCILFLVGILWTVFYYGVLQPMYTTVSGQYGSSIFDANQLTFVQTFIAWWPFTLTLAILYWLWQKSNKRNLETM